ncbi:MAG: hypothetical protein IJ630_11820 [Treponema sp.]|nr:hypothetical protein [Treponema sp.]
MKKLIFTLTALSLASLSFAQDYGFGDSMGSDDFGGGFEEESMPSVTITGEVGASARAWIGTENEESGLYDTKGYDGIYDVSKTDIESDAYANVELNYEGDYTGANLKLKLDSSTLKDHPEDVIDEVYATGSFKDGRFQLKAGKIKEVWGKGDKVHVLDNFNANDYSDFIFPDYIDRRIGEVMFKATANLSWDYNLKLEGIYTPWMTPDRFAANGKLVPNAQRNVTNAVSTYATAGLQAYILALEQARLTASTASALQAEAKAKGCFDQTNTNFLNASGDSVSYSTLVGMATQANAADLLNDYYDTSIVTKLVAAGFSQEQARTMMVADAYEKYLTATVQSALTNYTLALSNASALSSDSSSLYPDTYSLRYGQAGLRLTGTFGGFDWGTSYYYGHYKQPSFDARKLESYIAKYLVGESADESEKFLQYDQLQVFGFEAAFVLWKFNTRWEFAYNMTEDYDGDNPAVHNNSIAWVGGFDIDLPIHNLNLNVQETGTYILKGDKIKDSVFRSYDVDNNTDDKFTRNKLIVLLSDKFLNEKLTIECQGIWGIENKEFVVVPKIEYNVSEGLSLTARGAYMYSNNENGEFYNFTADSENHDKAFFELSAKYQF